MKITFSLDQIESVAQKVLEQNPEKIILFNGEMGVGKTTFIKQFCKTLGVTETTSSPTFSLVNEYKTKDDKTIYHFDFYRLNQETEALDMGIEDYLYSGNWCFIEWSEKIINLIPDNYSVISIELQQNQLRLLTLSHSR